MDISGYQNMLMFIYISSAARVSIHICSKNYKPSIMMLRKEIMTPRCFLLYNDWQVFVDTPKHIMIICGIFCTKCYCNLTCAVQHFFVKITNCIIWIIKTGFFCTFFRFNNQSFVDRCVCVCYFLYENRISLVPAFDLGGFEQIFRWLST